jgi:hypothetical protein
VGGGAEIYAVQIGQQRRVRLCSSACVVAYVQQHEQDRDPFARPRSLQGEELDLF